MSVFNLGKQRRTSESHARKYAAAAALRSVCVINVNFFEVGQIKIVVYIQYIFYEYKV